VLVVFPYSPVDQTLAVKLAAWIKELGKNEGHHVLIVRDIRCHSNNDASIRHDLLAVFDSVQSIDVVERIDGWPLAPNIIFRTAAKHIQYVCHQPWLWIEGDCVPLKSGWVEAIWKEYAACGKPFLGDFVNVENVIPHMSGIAVYPGKLTEYAGNAVMADEVAWDCAAASQIVPLMAQTHLIKHRWKHPPFNNQSEVDNLLGQLGDAVLFHADKSGTLIDFLRERRYPAPAQQNPVQVNQGAGIGISKSYLDSTVINNLEDLLTYKPRPIKVGHGKSRIHEKLVS
jgi:hypothetical protein